jgi:hypothetical protein
MEACAVTAIEACAVTAIEACAGDGDGSVRG